MNKKVADVLRKRMEPCVQNLQSREMSLRVARIALRNLLPKNEESYDIMKLDLELLKLSRKDSNRGDAQDEYLNQLVFLDSSPPPQDPLCREVWEEMEL